MTTDPHEQGERCSAAGASGPCPTEANLCAGAAVTLEEITMEQMSRSMGEAATWETLGRLSSQADALYRAGCLTLDQAERLASLAVQRACAIPAETVLSREVPAEEWLPPSSQACSNCGSTSRWFNHGEPVCAVCHPHPGPLWLHSGRRSEHRPRPVMGEETARFVPDHDEPGISTTGRITPSRRSA